MFATFSYLGIVVFGGAFHNSTGSRSPPLALLAPDQLGVHEGTVVCITYQDQIRTGYLIFGSVVVAANSLGIDAGVARASIRPLHTSPLPPTEPIERVRRCCGVHVLSATLQHPLAIRGSLFVHHGIFEGVVKATICCLLLFVGLALNSTAASCRDAAAHNASLPDETRIEHQARHDMLHGTWHCLSAMALLAMAMTMHRGLCSLGGKMAPPRRPS